MGRSSFQERFFGGFVRPHGFGTIGPLSLTIFPIPKNAAVELHAEEDASPVGSIKGAA